MNQKKYYESPVVEVIQMENEGVIAASGGTGSGESYIQTPMPGSARISNTSASELEEMINEIFTINN